MAVLTLFPILAIVFICWLDPSSALKPPQNVTKDLLNLNLSLYWGPPDDASNLTTYTVTLREKKVWRSIPHCTNITKTECTSITNFFIAEYGTDARKILKTKSIFRVTRREHPSLIDNSPSASVTVEVFPYVDATISAPDIEILELTFDSIEVALLAPETLFYDGETQQFFRMDDNKLGGFPKVKFNYSLWRISGQDSNKVYEASPDDSSKVVLISELTPYTLYALAVSARIGLKKFSKDNSTLIFRTKEAAPSRGPILLVPFAEELDCRKLNRRHVQIKWKAPAKEYWNGKSVHYEVRLHGVQDGDEYVTSIAVMNASSTSTTVYDLSRLDKYDIVVYANTSGGGIPSTHRSLPGADSEKAGLKPEDLHRRNTSYPVKIIEWKPPSGYEECILQYRVIVESDGQIVRKTEVKNATFLDISDLEPGTYVAQVSVITKGRNYTSEYGLSASLLLNVAQPKIYQMIIPVAVFLAFVFVVMTFICHVIKSLRSNMTFSSLDNNPILRKAFSQTYSPLRQRAVEKEMFNALRDSPTSQSQVTYCEETSLSTDGYSTESMVSVVQDNADAEPRVPHEDNLNVGSNQPLKVLHSPSDTDEADDDQDAVHEALMQQHREPSRSAGGETKPESTSSQPADKVQPSCNDDVQHTKHSDIKQSQLKSVEESLSLPCTKLSKKPFDSTPSPPIGIGLGYTVLANIFPPK